MRATPLVLIGLLGTATTVAAADPVSFGARVVYQGRIDGIYADDSTSLAERTAPASSEVEPLGATQKRVEDQLKLSDALRTLWGVEITPADIQAEYERILERSTDRDRLQRLLRALDNDGRAIAACLVEPILTRRLVHRSYWWDPQIHSPVRQDAKVELEALKHQGAIPECSAQRTLTEWRHTREAPPHDVVFENGVQIQYLNDPEWQRLLQDLRREWNPALEAADQIPLNRYGDLMEEREYFWAFAVVDRDATHLRIASCTWWKPRFSDWWDDHSDRFSAAVPEATIPVHPPVRQPSSRFDIAAKADPITSDVWFPIDANDSDAPLARLKHTVVWTGSTMIVWGGTNGHQYFSSGGVYDPATDSWTPTSDGTGCPTARIGHTATWVGSTMVIWGGWNGAETYNTGSAYDPVSQTWTALIVDANTPYERRGHTAWTNPGQSLLYIWGGRHTFGLTSTGGWYQFDPAGWFPLPDDATTPSARESFVSVPYHEGSQAIWGGIGISDYPDDGAFYSGSSWTPLPLANPPSPRFAATGVRSGGTCTSGTKKVIIWGGFAPFDTPSITDTGAILDTGSHAWDGPTPVGAAVPSGRMNHTAVMDTQKDRMIIWGGVDDSGQTATGGVLDLCTNTWRATDTSDADLPAARTRHTAVWTGTSMIVWGGSSGSFPFGDGGIYTYCWDSGPHSTAPPTVGDDDVCTYTGIRVEWTDGIDWNDYNVNRRVDVLRDGITIAADIPATDGAYVDSTAIPNQSYEYGLRVYNSCGLSTLTAVASALDQGGAGTPTVSGAPNAADADGCETSSGVLISWPQDPDAWNDNGATDRKYRVWQHNPIDGWVALGDQLDYGVTSYLDDTPFAGASSYKVKYINGCGLNADTAQTPVVNDLGGEIPTVTQTVIAQDDDTCEHSGIRITWPQDPDDWGDNGDGFRFYRVRRSTDGVNFSGIGINIPYPAITFVDTNAPAGQITYYRVRYKNGCSMVADSGVDTATDTIAAAEPVISVNNTSLDPDACDDGGILIGWEQDPDTWCDDVSGGRSYDILRNGTPIHTGIAYGVTTFTDATGVNGTSYLYQVRYNNSNGFSASTNGDEAVDHEGQTPTVTENSTAADTDTCTDAGITVNWPESPSQWGDSDSGTRTYDVVRDSLTIQTGIGYGTTSFVDTTGDNGTQYLYQVRYINGCGQSGTTSGDLANDRPIAPQPPANNNTATDLDACAATGVLVTWDPDPDGAWGDGGGAHTYEVLRDGASLQSDIEYGTTTFVDSTATPGVTYLYTVRYWNCGGLHSETTGTAASDGGNGLFCDDFETGDTSAWW